MYYITDNLHPIADFNRGADKICPLGKVYDGAHRGRIITTFMARLGLNDSVVDSVRVILALVSVMLQTSAPPESSLHSP